jgi:hypothetical protein
MSARIQQARISDEYVAGDVQSHQSRANEPALGACDSNEEIEYQRWTNAQTLIENNVLKKLLIDLLRAVDAAEVRIPERHLAAVKRDLILLESRTVKAHSAPSSAHESQWLGEQAKLPEEFADGSISEPSGHESVPRYVRENVPATKPQPDRSIKRNIQAYGPEPQPVPQAEIIAQYEHMMRD